MGQFKDINLIFQEIIKDKNIHPDMRDAMRKSIVKQTPIDSVYVLMCDGTVTDVFTDKAMAMHDLHICQMADTEEGLPHDWTVVKRQLTTTTLS